MKCCSAQVSSCWEEPEKTIKKVESSVQQAAAAGARIIAFPEQFATGWDPCSTHHIQDTSGTIVSGLKKYAAEYSIAILGSFRKRGDPLPANSAFVVGTDGSVRALYEKMHPFTLVHEERYYRAGDDIAVFELDGMKFGIAICYDLRFPSLFHLYAKKEACGVFLPSAWPGSRIRHWELFITARAVENQMYIIGINTTGKTPVDVYDGASMTADPDGNIIARAGEGDELLFSDLDTAKVKAARCRFPSHKDQRTELYHRLHQRD
ncbi:MAG: carbon-nitrogen hydrolase family protein [Methanoregula sp.]|nr:MAG: carbon-nitrogen hydrolase family protein [Methanoregula sp.]